MVLYFIFDVNSPEDPIKTKWEDTNISPGWAEQQILSATWNLPSTPVRRQRSLNAKCHVSVPPHHSLAAQASVLWTLLSRFPLWVARSSLKLSTNRGTGFHFDAHRVKMHLYTKEIEPDSAFVTTLPEICSPLLFNLFLFICTRVKGVRTRPQVWFSFVPAGIWCLIFLFSFLSQERMTFVFFPSFSPLCFSLWTWKNMDHYQYINNKGLHRPFCHSFSSQDFRTLP